MLTIYFITRVSLVKVRLTISGSHMLGGQIIRIVTTYKVSQAIANLLFYS
jgi:hypothetical protein